MKCLAQVDYPDLDPDIHFISYTLFKNFTTAVLFIFHQISRQIKQQKNCTINFFRNVATEILYPVVAELASEPGSSTGARTLSG